MAEYHRARSEDGAMNFDDHLLQFSLQY
jgi:hypothetical protein